MVSFKDIAQAHASILNGDPNIILGHHGGQQQVTVSAPGGQQIPVTQIIAAQAGQTHGKITLYFSVNCNKNVNKINVLSVFIVFLTNEPNTNIFIQIAIGL